jgi:hypothetical protein
MAGQRLVSRCVEMVFHHLIHLGERPVLGIGAVEKDGDVVCVRVPGVESILQPRLVAGLERGQDVCRPCDVLFEELGQLVAGILA